MHRLPQMMIFGLTFMLAGNVAAQTVAVDPSQASVAIAPDAIEPVRNAADELAKHLRLITEADIPVVSLDQAATSAGGYVFHVGHRPADDRVPFASEEARWRVTAKAAWFYGDLDRYGDGPRFAVYDFLEKQLGVRWIEPGDRGIAFTAQSPLQLEAAYVSWTPRLMFRKIRQSVRVQQQWPPLPEKLRDFSEFRPTLEAHNAAARDEMQWQKRMRMGGARAGGGHAYTHWWERYERSHPGLFALTENGTRAPVLLDHRTQKHSEEWIKVCPSNPAVAERLIEEWLPRKDIVQYISIGPNDGVKHFCRCDACTALDQPLPGESFHEHLTDRYVVLANRVARLARQHRPDARVTLYAYLKTLYPPRKQKVDPNVVVQLVPYVIPLDLAVNRDLFRGWHEAGARRIAFRPNYHFKYLAGVMPLGIEKQMFDVFQQAVQYGAITADYDSLMGRWPVNSMTNYVLAKAMADPLKPFGYWEDHYCEAYGPAADDVKAYHRYWRENAWEKRLAPNLRTIADRGGAGSFVRGLMWSLGDYFNAEDFDRAGAILARASQPSLTPPQQQRLRQLILANDHARLVYRAVTADGVAKRKPARKLMAFRKAHKDTLRFNWLGVIGAELTDGDITGINVARTAHDYAGPWLKTDAVWRFKLDPQDIGLNEDWHSATRAQTESWQRIRTDAFWENQADADDLLSRQTREALPKYDGIAWYSTQIEVPASMRAHRVFLRFGAVDESCWVYVNGREAGRHIYTEKDDWKTPFEIPIDAHIDWDSKTQHVTVRVQDKAGVGGVWKPVWVVSKLPNP